MTEENDIIFREEQKFGTALTAAIVVAVAVTAYLGGLSLRQLIYEQESTSILPIILLIIAGVIVPIAVGVLFLTLKLETIVRSDGLYVRFFPIHIHFKRFAPEDLSQYYARRYKPILEYGGWGIRYGLKNGRAYNVRGNRGVQLVFTNGKRLLIGSGKPDELAEAISRIV